MDEMNTTPAAQKESSEMSHSDKVMNVFSAPGELFDYVAKSEKQTSNWSLPFIFTVIVSIIFVLVAFSQAPIQDQMRDQQDKAFQKRVESGKMTQEQVDQAMTMVPKPGSPLFMITGSVGAAFIMAFMLFGLSLVFWLTGKWVFKSSATYAKTLEVTGLSMYIFVLGSIITLLLAVAMGSLYATPSLALAVSQYDPSNTVHKLLSAISVFNFWFLFVVAVGLGKLFSVSTGKALGAVGVLWGIWTAATVLVNFGG
ncbi:MAG TPA: YIP1 family protein [Bacteroidota bacterium]|nr:YIP1 family protein [Bacteroidota bacterium]